MDQETLDILAALNALQPTTQQVDYSGFMKDFQPVQNYPNYFVPQQGLLQNTPTLDTLSDLDVMQQRPQNLLNMINQYPTLESDFQRSFAVNPDTFNMNVYQPLPYDADYWNSFVNQGGSTGGDSGIDLGTAATIIGGTSLITGGNDTIDGGTNTTTITGGDDGNDSIDGGTGNDVITVSSVVGGTGNDTIDGATGNDVITVSSVTGGTGNDTIDGGAGNDLTTVSSVVGGTGNDVIDSGSSNDLTTVSSVIGGTGNDTLEIDNSGSNVVEVSNLTSDVSGSSGNDSINNNENTNVTDLTSATDILTNLYDTGQITLDELNTNTIDLINKSSVIGINNALTSTLDNLGINTSTSLLNTAGEVLLTSGGTGFGYVPTYDNITGAYTGVKTGFTPNLDSDQLTQLTSSDIGLSGTIKNTFTDFINNPLNEGFGTAGSALNDATSFTGGEALALGGGLLSLNAALEEATPSNVFGTAVGLGASGLLGGTATSAGVAGTGIQGLATNPITAPIGVALFIAEKLQADPSNKTGFGQYDAATGKTTSFGMEGDKFKQGNVDASTSIASAMGDAVNNITAAFGLNVEGDILAQTGNRDPLNITYGNQESEATTNDRLNYNTESGDIQSGDGIQRLYYTGKDGFDGSRLASDLVHSTTLASLKAIANGEDSINLANFTLPAKSADDVKNTYLLKGFDETAAEALTSAARSASGATSELLGGLLLANTTNEDNYLTTDEKEKLISLGYTNEQLDTMLYGTTEESLLALNTTANDKDLSALRYNTDAPAMYSDPNTGELLSKADYEALYGSLGNTGLLTGTNVTVNADGSKVNTDPDTGIIHYFAADGTMTGYRDADGVLTDLTQT